MFREEWHVPVVDADAVAREVVAKDSTGLRALVAHFGPDILQEDGELDRSRMRARVASDPATKAALDGITHPLIRATIFERLAKLREEGHRLAVVEAALMVETGSHRTYDAVLVVSCTPELQLQRLMQRDGMTETGARALIATQMPLTEKEKAATHILRNDGTEAELREEVRKCWAILSA